MISLGPASRPIGELGAATTAVVHHRRASSPPRTLSWFSALASGSTLLAATSWSCNRSSDLLAPTADSTAALAGAAGLPGADAAGTGVGANPDVTVPSGGATGAGMIGATAGISDDGGASGNAPGAADARANAGAGGSVGLDSGTDADAANPPDDPFEPSPAAPGACEVLAIELERRPKLVVFVLDTSASMDEPVASTAERTKWDTVATVLRTTFATRDPAVAVGLVFLPTAAETAGEASGCLPSEGNVPVAPLSSPEHVALLESGLTARSASPGSSHRTTPDAWRMGVRLLGEAIFDPPAGYEDATATVVLITDGMPTHSLECSAAPSADAGSNAAIGSADWDGFLAEVRSTTTRTGVPTHVIGLPGSERADSVPLVDGKPEYSPRQKLSALAFATRSDSEEELLFGCPFSLPLTQPADQTDSVDTANSAAVADAGAEAFASPFGAATTTTVQSLCQTDLVDSVDLEAALAEALMDDTGCLYRVPSEDRVQDELGANVFLAVDSATMKYYPDGGSTAVTLGYRPPGDEFGFREWDWKVGGLGIELQTATCERIMGDPNARLVLELGCVLGQ